VGVGGQATVRFQGDVRSVTLRRNGEVIEPLRGGNAPVPVGVENELVDFTDVADFGYYLYSPDVFRPDGPQKPPEVTLEIEDLKNTGAKRIAKLAPAVTARLWNDFQAFFRQATPTKPLTAYTMMKSCTVDPGAAAMGGVGGTVGPANPGTCTYIVTPPKQ